MALDLHNCPRRGALNTSRTCLRCQMTWLPEQLGSLSLAAAVVVAVWNPCSHSELLRPGPAQPRALLEGHSSLRLCATSLRALQVPLVRAPSTPFPLPVQIGNIYQQFSSPEEGEVRNIIKLSVPLLLEPGGPSAFHHVVPHAFVWTCIEAHATGDTGHPCWCQSSGVRCQTWHYDSRRVAEPTSVPKMRQQPGMGP